MDMPLKKKLFFYFIPIIILNLLVFFPSFFHMPRSDQLIYLANTAQQTDWYSLAIKDYAITRADTVYFMHSELWFRPFFLLYPRDRKMVVWI